MLYKNMVKISQIYTKEDDTAVGVVPVLKTVSTLTGMGFDSSVFRQ
jgi:hypothetical protein